MRDEKAHTGHSTQAKVRRFVAGLVIGASLWGVAGAHDKTRAVVQTIGRLQGFCPEDERLVPVKHHGYNAESVSGWTYTCFPWENKRRMAP